MYGGNGYSNRGFWAAIAAASVSACMACSACAPSGAGGDVEQVAVTDDRTDDGAPSEGLYNLADDYAKLPRDNVYKVADAEAMFKFREHGTGILVFGFKTCPACNAYIPMLDELAREHGVDKIVYYDLEEDRKSGSDTYARVLDEMAGHTKYNADGDERLFVPSVSFIDHGEIVFYDDETSELDDDVTPIAQYWTDDAVAAWEAKMAPQLDSIARAVAECGECS